MTVMVILRLFSTANPYAANAGWRTDFDDFLALVLLSFGVKFRPRRLTENFFYYFARLMILKIERRRPLTNALCVALAAGCDFYYFLQIPSFGPGR